MKLFLPAILTAAILAGCGTTYTRLPEIWDQADSDALYNMEVQVKQAIYCELKKAARDIKIQLPRIQRIDNSGNDLASDEDQWFPDSWGVLVQLTIQAEEKSALTPGVVFKTPLPNQESFSLGFGGEVSADNTRSDKFNSYYSAKQLNMNSPKSDSKTGPCREDYFDGDPKSTSSPFLNASNLGIREWLKSAVRVINFERSSRARESGEGPPLGMDGTASDSSTYNNKFVIISSANIAPSWNLIRIGTPASPLFDVSRTRTHELIMTVGPGAESFKVSRKTGQITAVNRGPSIGARDAFNATLIGSAVSNSITNALRPFR